MNNSNSQKISVVFVAYFHQKYKFEQFTKLKITKNISIFKNLSNRDILKPSAELKAYHKFLEVFILNKLKVNKKISFGYASNNTIYDCIYPHRQAKYFLSVDIERFFDSISKTLINTLISNNTDNIAIDISDHQNQIINLLTYNDKLPMGFSTSSIIANATMFEFDNLIYDYCQTKNITYTRYADDLIFSAKHSLKPFLPVLSDKLNKQFNGALKINNSKVKIQSHSSKVEMLGLIIMPNHQLTINKTIKSNVEALLYFYINDKSKFIDILKNKYNNNLNKVFGIIAYINSVDKNFLNKLRKKYGNYIVDGFLRKSINE